MFGGVGLEYEARDPQGDNIKKIDCILRWTNLWPQEYTPNALPLSLEEASYKFRLHCTYMYMPDVPDLCFSFQAAFKRFTR